MDITKTLEGIEKFFLEILGYFLPGLTVLLGLYAFIDNKYVSFSYNMNELNSWIFIALSYIVGYLIHGIALFRDDFYEKVIIKSLNWVGQKILSIEECKHYLVITRFKNIITYISNKQSDRKKVNTDIPQNPTYLLSQSILKQLFDSKISTYKFDSNQFTLNDLRNISMSYVPQSDHKVYTFMFRSDLSGQVGLISLILGLWGILACISSQLWNNTLLLKTQDYFLNYYILMVLLSYLFHKTRIRFYRIAMCIPFSMFVATYCKLGND
mgnify:CR=1 FL=1